MILSKKADAFLRSIENDKRYAETKRLFKKFWIEDKNRDLLGCCEFRSPEDETVRKVRGIIHKYLKSLDFNDRPSMREAINFFFDGFAEEWRSGQPMCMMDKCWDPTERTIFMLKYLQGGEKPAAEARRSQAEIAEYLGLSENAVGAALASLERKLNLLGSNIEIERSGCRGNNYDNTVHPVFLALNLTEAFFLTEVLRRTFDTISGEGKRWQDTAADIAYDVRRQLSENYCIGQMDRLHKQYFGDRAEVDFTKAPSGRTPKIGYRMEGIDEEEVWRLGSLEKLGYGRNVVVMKLKGEDEVYKGSVNYDEEGDVWFFECADGRRIEIPPAEALEKFKIER